jgi:hypothetical protein
MLVSIFPPRTLFSAKLSASLYVVQEVTLGEVRGCWAVEGKTLVQDPKLYLWKLFEGNQVGIPRALKAPKKGPDSLWQLSALLAQLGGFMSPLTMALGKGTFYRCNANLLTRI